jgi:DNA-binding response OmpR family regulator
MVAQLPDLGPRVTNPQSYAHSGRRDLMNQPYARILLVDDEAVIRRTLGTLLRRQGYEVWTAADGPEGFAWLREGVFDLLLIDLMLPGGMSGLEIAQRAHAYQPDAAVLILTGSSELADAVVDSSACGFETMFKTASPQDVLDRVAALLGQERELHEHIRSVGQG